MWTFTAELLRREKENRSENQRRHRIKNAGFPQLRHLNELDTDALPQEARKALPALETLDFIKSGRKLILYGNPGTGKTHLATALAFNRWNEIIEDKVLVTAMVDRLTHKAILLNMTGKSYRMKETQEMLNLQI